MRIVPVRLSTTGTTVAVLALLCTLNGCSSVSTRNQVFGVTATAIAGVTPSTEIEQLYYLGVFDPQDQLPPTLYRIRIRGQSSTLNMTRFASGWVPAAAVDSLGSSIEFENGKVKVEKASGETDTNTSANTLGSDRRLMLFGPEGFREAPKNHRLVVLMGSSPEAFFQSIDQALGTIALATQGKSAAGAEREWLAMLLQLRTEKDRLNDLAGNK
jgi:hypothetical protein